MNAAKNNNYKIDSTHVFFLFIGILLYNIKKMSSLDSLSIDIQNTKLLNSTKLNMININNRGFNLELFCFKQFGKA